MGIALMTVILTACTDGDGDRRFAGDPLPTEDRITSTSTLAPVAVASPSTPIAGNFASPETLLLPVDALNQVYFWSGGQVWQLDSAKQAAHRFLPVESRNELAFVASPTGDRVAVLVDLEPASGAGLSLLIVDSEGREMRRVRVPTETSMASPVASPLPIGRDRAPIVDWAADSGEILVLVDDGTLFVVPPEGKPRPVRVAGPDVKLLWVKWSSDGTAIASLQQSAGPQSPVRLFVSPVGDVPTDPTLAAPARPDVTVTGMAWLPGGSDLLFTEARYVNAEVEGGDLFRVAPTGQNRALVASAGRFGPAASITNFLASPDGLAVAYTVFVPSPDGPLFHSLWVQSLESGAAVQVPLETNLKVTDLWWTVEGLVWRTAIGANSVDDSASEGEFSLWRWGGKNDPVRLYQFGGNASTPIASPAATPVS
ncbi:MAG: hypothetical protein H0T49_05730 [Chloroflexia bacterium]|nr:hypothetical protein [Chloroflexia bacterium]